MSKGVQATISFNSSSVCPLTELSKETDSRITGVTTSISNSSSDSPVTEFTVNQTIDLTKDITTIFSYSSGTRYRLVHDHESVCPCKILGSFECAPAHYVADNGQLTLVFYSEDYDQLQLIVGVLREEFESLDIKRLIRSPVGSPEPTQISVDLGNLTSRQIEVMKTAFEMGYFNRPRDANAKEVAAELNIHPSTLNEHLGAAQTKLLKEVLWELDSGTPQE